MLDGVNFRVVGASESHLLFGACSFIIVELAFPSLSSLRSLADLLYAPQTSIVSRRWASTRLGRGREPFANSASRRALQRGECRITYRSVH